MVKKRHRSPILGKPGEFALYLVIVGQNGGNVWMTPQEAENLKERLEIAKNSMLIDDYQIVNEFDGALAYDDFVASLSRKGI
jgi:hypothetical protein